MWADTTDQLLPKDQRRTTGLTKLAQKYSHPTGTIESLSHRILKCTGKSGLTPVSSPLPTPITKRKLTTYQKRRYYGFSAAELQKLGTMAGLESEKMEIGLSNPIHPMYELGQWETRDEMPRHRGAIPIRGDEEGFWLAENLIVWKVLEPSLRLASLLLTNANHYPWWDALFNGQYRDVPSYRIPPPHNDPSTVLLSFHQRPPEQRNTPAAISLLQKRLVHVSQKIRFRLFSGYTSTNTGCTMKDKWHLAETGTEIWHGGPPNGIVRVSVAVELLQPLQRWDLTDAERIAAQFRIAATLIHETAHAVWITIKPGLSPPRPTTEPYFEDEVLCELGWSLEDKIWGGEALELVQTPYSRGGPGLPHMGNLKTNWFTDRHKNYANGSLPLLEYVVPLPDGEDDPFYQFDYWPVTLQWTYSLFQSGFWSNLITKYGAKATEMGPVVVGTRRWADNSIDDGFQVLAGPDQDEIVIDENLWKSFTPEQQTTVRTENSRRAKAAQLYQSIAQSTGPFSPLPGPSASDSSSDETEPEPNFHCPRWDEITAYLFANRASNELALDTLTFDIPEPTLYRYILDRGGLSITPSEFRAFLLTANKNKQLFAYAPFPGIGTVTRLPTGWPRETDYTIPRMAPPSQAALQNFKREMKDPSFQERLYAEFEEFRDLDYEVLRGLANAFVSPSNRIPASEMELVVNEVARESGGGCLTLGPKGVARLTFEIKESVRGEWMSEFSRGKMERNKELIKEAVEEERKRKEGEVEKFVDIGREDSGVDLGGSVYLEDLMQLEGEVGFDLSGLDLRALGDLM